MTDLITRDELKAELTAGAVTVVDALPRSYYDQQHIPGALNLTEDQVRELAPALLPDKSAIVTYCSNTACQNSQAVANLLANAGYTNVRKYGDGIQDWVEAGEPTETSTSPSA